ncbi:hypothetical protein E2C01_077744 [Portunus trituberculatus]|uniref:Uncharacterized protein n=1 Tax=Portunus trituberculatus TaxID=210409 RepID=A0A5B7ISA2_PORTR|nr:hypothetical protein [Portunus trituberculatus]
MQTICAVAVPALCGGTEWRLAHSRAVTLIALHPAQVTLMVNVVAATQRLTRLRHSAALPLWSCAPTLQLKYMFLIWTHLAGQGHIINLPARVVAQSTTGASYASLTRHGRPGPKDTLQMAWQRPSRDGNYPAQFQ